ncbi:hypothetical protein HOD08_00050 [bacterium]|nr:hypothetical protein [bacterium]
MSAQTQSEKFNPKQLKSDEKIFAVRRTDLFKQSSPQGFTPTAFSGYEKTLEGHGAFLWRSKLENDPTYKQIIPYMVFTHNKKIFVFQRKDTATEQRLKSKFSIGIGGHLRSEDITGTKISGWGKREFEEEIEYHGSYKIKELGLINNDENAVGLVHAGFATLLIGNSDKISIKSEHKDGWLLSFDECKKIKSRMEDWSQFVMCYLEQHKELIGL